MQIFKRDPATREVLIRMGHDRALPLFGTLLPFIGWKLISCNPAGEFEQMGDYEEPRFVRRAFGFGWLGHGFYAFAPSSPIYVVRQG
ncbi:hypothetical protein K9U40_20010 [Xanthobacter autotrophicus]|uniref:hypothetical protein n=1 Tax=Xanthobacter TaxID=279 RepID=UPI0024AC79F2|nr:hypothetical protein [Xanthobacter autotrophicus]MDI4666588.1 hypothetical protein [Xanthobacter autotrophicus]